MQLSRLLLLGFVTLIPALWAQDNAGAQAGLTPAMQQRHTVHSQQVHGGIPGQIPNRMATESGDIHLDNLQGSPYRIMSDDPRNTLANLSCESDLVVVGKFGKATSYPTEDQGYIYSDLDFTVEEVVKNNQSAPVAAGQNLTITRPGGLLTINGRHVYALRDNFPLFHPGQEALLYLRSLQSVGTYSLPYPTGFLLSGENALPLDKILFGQFEGMKKGAVLDLGREAAGGCPIPISQQRVPHLACFWRGGS